MGRLTNKKEADAQRKSYKRRLEQGYPRNIPEERFLKLAAYEDTGLTPAQIKYMLPKQSAEEAVERMRDEKERYDEWFAWKQAESEGRLVVQPCAPGTEVWVVDRDEDGCAVDVSGYMFLAKAGDAVILTPYINDLDNAHDILAYHMNETTENYETNLMVFPAYDCYTTREKAEEAMEQEAEDE